MPDNSAAIVIDIGTTNCKVTCFSCLDATTLGAHKFVTAKQISFSAISAGRFPTCMSITS